MARRISAIGVHAGDDVIAAAQITRGGALHAWAVIDRAQTEFDEREAERLRGVLDRRGFRGHEIVLGAHEQASLSAVLEIPDRSSGAPVEEIARAEIARLRRVDAHSITCQLVDLPASMRAGQGSSVLAFGCAHAAAESLIEPYQTVGLEVIAIDSRACALARACEKHLRPVALGAAVHVGGGGSRIVVTHQGELVYERWFSDRGLASLIEQIQRDLRIDRELSEYLLYVRGVEDDDDAPNKNRAHLRTARETIVAWSESLAEECAVALEYAGERFGGAAPDIIVAAGQGSQVAGLGALLADRLGCSTQVWRPADVLRVCDTNDPALALAVGLAQRFDP